METQINRRKQIFETAARLIRRKGYEATTMRDIASELGIEAASLYHHIKSKEQILDLICFDMALKFSNAINEVNDIYFNSEEKLRMCIHEHVKILTENPENAGVFLTAWRSLQEEQLTKFIKLRNDYEQGIKQIIREGVDEDIFDNVDLKFATLSILSTINGVNEWYKQDGEMTPTQIAIKLGDFIMGGLRKKLITDLNYKP
jgi:AcrR family transcriptional regulator